MCCKEHGEQGGACSVDKASITITANAYLDHRQRRWGVHEKAGLIKYDLVTGMVTGMVRIDGSLNDVIESLKPER